LAKSGPPFWYPCPPPLTRLSLDQTVTPTFLVHVGVGEMRYDHIDSAPESSLTYGAVQKLGLVGAFSSAGPFPEITGLASAQGGFTTSVSGPSNPTTIGPTNAGQYVNDNPTVTISATWVRGNHTYKAGAEGHKNIWSDINYSGQGGIYNFSSAETGLPYLQLASLKGGSVGFPYASFLLGQVDSASVNSGQDPQMRKSAYGVFIQDTWKITRTLTLDYGLRWDYQTALHKVYNRFSEFAPNIANPSAGGLPGAVAYEGTGPGRCDCSFIKTYPFALGPRLGLAYQINSKTVIRAGWA
jgi:outer membrane receptor protein involved in Fe transport